MKVGFSIENYPSVCIIYYMEEDYAVASFIQNVEKIKGRQSFKGKNKYEIKKDAKGEYIENYGMKFYIRNFEVIGEPKYVQLVEVNCTLAYSFLFKNFSDKNDNNRFVLGKLVTKPNLPMVKQYKESEFKIYRVSHEKRHHYGYIMDRLTDTFDDVKFNSIDYQSTKDWNFDYSQLTKN